MNARERKLLFAVGGVATTLILAALIRSAVVTPLREVDRRIAATRDQIDKIQAERRAYFDAEDRIKKYTLQSFADTVEQASARSGESLTKQILQSGLSESEFTRLPLGPRKLRGANEIGWSVQGEGPLANVLNLLFLLHESPYVHRLEGLTFTSGDVPGAVNVRFRQMTLVMDPAPEVERTNLPPRFTLESAERQTYDGIVARDLLRPYIKRPPVPTPGTPPGQTNPRNTTPPSAPGPESFRIVSLSEWQGQPEIHVRDLTAQKTIRYRPGDTLAGGTIVCVDYRPQPNPGNAFLRSDSRVILRMGTDFFAIERGQTLADKRKIALEQIPPEARAAAKTQP